MTIEIHKVNELVGKVVDLKKISNRKQKPPRYEEKQDIQNAITAMIARGEIKPWQEGDPKRKTDDPQLREDFGRLLYLGADERTINRILGIAHNTYMKLKRQHLDNNIEALVDTGTVGMVAMSFDKLDYASRRTLQLIGSLGEGKNAYVLMHAIRLLKEIESEKVQLLVKTGAIQVKKKVEISGNIGVEQSINLLPGEKARSIMVNIIGKLAEVANEEDEVPSDDSIDVTPDLPALPAKQG